jgi:carbon-monoxide dehydrogenase small subunit
MAKQSVTVTVNGTRYQRDIEPRLLLSDFLRHDLSLTGKHVGCEHGVCGSCNVLVDGIATRSCLYLAVQADGSSVETVETLGMVAHCIRCSRHFGKSTVCNAASARPEC